VNIKSFFVATLSTALDLGIAAPEDVLRHVTTDVLSIHLPRPLWARLLTACLGAPKVDATLVVETIGVPNLCEHIPSPIIWACIAEVARRSLGGQIVVVERPAFNASAAPPAMPSTGAVIAPMTTSASSSKPAISLTPPPPPTLSAPAPMAPPPPMVVGTSIPSPNANPLADIVAELESEQQRDDRPPPPPSRARTPTGQRFRQSNTGIGRLAANNTRRPQASALPTPVTSTPRRGQTESDSFEIESETSVGTKEDWKAALAVEEDQLVDWQHTEETVTHGDEYTGRKR
jgi:hypothetical protein